jgi:rfaE bifunctional protein nucleotidyltransferase chain/domain
MNDTHRSGNIFPKSSGYFEKTSGESSGSACCYLKKAIPFGDLTAWRQKLPTTLRPLVVTNGVFDIIHSGHIQYLERAKSLGATLMVGLTGDEAVKILKGNDRPLVSEIGRATVISALEFVDAVCVFPQVDACSFLEGVHPDLYVKGGDYTMQTINQKERRLLQKLNVAIQILPLLPGHSTSALLRNAAERREIKG